MPQPANSAANPSSSQSAQTTTHLSALTMISRMWLRSNPLSMLPGSKTTLIATGVAITQRCSWMQLISLLRRWRPCLIMRRRELSAGMFMTMQPKLLLSIPAKIQLIALALSLLISNGEHQLLQRIHWLMILTIHQHRIRLWIGELTPFTVVKLQLSTATGRVKILHLFHSKVFQESNPIVLISMACLIFTTRSVSWVSTTLIT